MGFRGENNRVLTIIIPLPGYPIDHSSRAYLTLPYLSQPRVGKGSEKETRKKKNACLYYFVRVVLLGKRQQARRMGGNAMMQGQRHGMKDF